MEEMLTEEELLSENDSVITKSTNKVEIVPIVLEKHPNADSLSLVSLFDGGYICVVRTEDWQGINKAAWCPPDSLVDVSIPVFSFLENGRPKERIRARRFRGILSYGLLVPAPEGFEIGDDVAEYYQIEHYIPASEKETGSLLSGRNAAISDVKGGILKTVSKYDVDSFQRYGKRVFEEGEPVWITEKVHGANGTWTYDPEKDMIYAMSRSFWKNPEYSNDWNKALEFHPEIIDWLKSNPDFAIRGELYGKVQSLQYGLPDSVRIAVFDLLHLPSGKYIDAEKKIYMAPELPWVPLINNYFLFDFDAIVEMASGPSLIETANHYREGIVVTCLKERWHPSCGRVNLKVVSEEYLTSK